MSEKFDKFAKALDALIEEGDKLSMAMRYECFGDEAFMKELGEKDAKKLQKILPRFRDKYQGWYSEAHAFIKQVLPDRLTDFESYYEYPRARKEINYQNYMIRDYLQGYEIIRGSGLEKRTIVDGKGAITHFEQQLNIVKAARDKLDSALIDLTAILQADLFDSEVESARALAKAGYLRAAGAVCGVVIEKHLLQICDAHSVPIRKKNPSISNFNEALKDKDAITVPQWRFIQHLADIRNLCDHAKGKEPTKDEIEDLLSGTEKVLKTIF